VNAAETKGRRLAQRRDRKRLVFVPVARMRHHVLARELPRGRLKRALFFGEGKVHGVPLPLGLTKPAAPAATGWNIRAVSGSNVIGRAAARGRQWRRTTKSRTGRISQKVSPHPILPRARCWRAMSAP